MPRVVFQHTDAHKGASVVWLTIDNTFPVSWKNYACYTRRRVRHYNISMFILLLFQKRVQNYYIYLTWPNLFLKIVYISYFWHPYFAFPPSFTPPHIENSVFHFAANKKTWFECRRIQLTPSITSELYSDIETHFPPNRYRYDKHTIQNSII